MVAFDDKCEPEIPYAMDYLFASDFYSKQDCRFELMKLLKSSVLNKTGVLPYNCKIHIPKTTSEMYNVYIYFRDIREIFTREEYHNVQVNSFVNQQLNYFTVLFNDVIKKHPIDQLKNLKLNQNGVFVEDFRIRSLAYAVCNAENELKKLWISMFPSIVYTARWESTLYLFFHSMDDIIHFAENNSVKFKEHSYNVIKKYDKDDFCSLESIPFILDLLDNYDRIGGRNYFNSDAMNGLRNI